MRFQFHALHVMYANLIVPLRGILRTAKAELEAGLVGDLRRRFTGEVLTDFVELARGALDEGGDGAKNVAAVL
ncbi:MAG: hypothetical protein DMG07_21765, partial [Acidobacteria bacterium]